MKEIYPKTKGYWLYVHRTPDNHYYVGVSQQQPYKRWNPSEYLTCSMSFYIDQYGWDNIEHIVVKDGLTKEEAVYWEDQLIQMYTEMGCCINQRHSGGWTLDKEKVKKYKQDYTKTYNQKTEVKEKHRIANLKYSQKPETKEKYKLYRTTPERKEKMCFYQQKPENKIYNRVNSYNHYHPDKVIETPKEAKQKYLETGYIPSYIKKDDLF